MEGSDYINASFIDVSTATTLSIIVVAIQMGNNYRDTPTRRKPT